MIFRPLKKKIILLEEKNLVLKKKILFISILFLWLRFWGKNIYYIQQLLQGCILQVDTSCWIQGEFQPDTRCIWYVSAIMYTQKSHRLNGVVHFILLIYILNHEVHALHHCVLLCEIKEAFGEMSSVIKPKRQLIRNVFRIFNSEK